VGLQITDLDSKQTGTVGFQFYGENASCFLSDTNPQLLKLGGNLFTNTPLGGVTVSVDVTPTVANSLEPSTILLAAYGSFSLLGFLRRRVPLA
jgi:hypothetical protein